MAYYEDLRKWFGTGGEGGVGGGGWMNTGQQKVKELANVLVNLVNQMPKCLPKEKASKMLLRIELPLQ
jgi:transcriptional regulator CtsR